MICEPDPTSAFVINLDSIDHGTVDDNHHVSGHTNDSDAEVTTIDESDSVSMHETDIDNASGVNDFNYIDDSAAVTREAQDPSEAEIVSPSNKPLHEMTVMDVVRPHLPLIGDLLEEIKSNREQRIRFYHKIKLDHDQHTLERKERKKHIRLIKRLHNLINTQAFKIAKLTTLNRNLKSDILQFRCPICLHNPKEEKTRCGYGYCSGCLQWWKDLNHSRCPVCRETLEIVSTHNYA